MRDVSRYFDLLVRILGANHPFRLAIGLLFGCALYFGSDLASRLMPGNQIWGEISKTHVIFFLAIGLIVSFVPLFLSRTTITEKNAYFVNLLSDLTDKGNLSKMEKRQLFRRLAFKLVDSARPDVSMDVDTDAAVREAAIEAERNDDDS